MGPPLITSKTDKTTVFRAKVGLFTLYSFLATPAAPKLWPEPGHYKRPEQKKKMESFRRKPPIKTRENQSQKIK